MEWLDFVLMDVSVGPECSSDLKQACWPHTISEPRWVIVITSTESKKKKKKPCEIDGPFKQTFGTIWLRGGQL